jgi:hypothetical protein
MRLVCPLLFLSVCPSVHRSVVHRFMCLQRICLSACLPVCLPVCLEHSVQGQGRPCLVSTVGVIMSPAHVNLWDVCPASEGCL